MKNSVENYKILMFSEEIALNGIFSIEVCKNAKLYLGSLLLSSKASINFTININSQQYIRRAH